MENNDKWTVWLTGWVCVCLFFFAAYYLLIRIDNKLAPCAQQTIDGREGK